MPSDFFNPRRRSLVRGNVLVLGSLFLAILLSHFPHMHPTPLLALPAFTAMAGTLDTARNMQRRWSMYHAGVILCVYMDLMAVTLVLFFFLYPYFLWFSSTR